MTKKMYLTDHERYTGMSCLPEKLRFTTNTCDTPGGHWHSGMGITLNNDNVKQQQALGHPWNHQASGHHLQLRFGTMWHLMGRSLLDSHCVASFEMGLDLFAQRPSNVVGPRSSKLDMLRVEIINEKGSRWILNPCQVSFIPWMNVTRFSIKIIVETWISGKKSSCVVLDPMFWTASTLTFITRLSNPTGKWRHISRHRPFRQRWRFLFLGATFFLPTNGNSSSVGKSWCHGVTRFASWREVSPFWRHSYW